MRLKNQWLLISLLILCLSCKGTETSTPAGSNTPSGDKNNSPGLDLSTFTPNQTFDGQETEILLAGTGFEKNMKIKVGTEEVTDYTLVDSQNLRLKIHPTSPGLLYITLNTSDGREATFADGLLIHHSNPAWGIESVPPKQESQAILNFLLNRQTNQFLWEVKDSTQQSSILYLGDLSSQTTYSFPPFTDPRWDPPCDETGCNLQPPPEFFYQPVSLLAVTPLMTTGGYLGIVQYRSSASPPRYFNDIVPFPDPVTLSAYLPYSTDPPHGSIDSFSESLFSDLQQKKIFALSVSDGTSQAPYFARLSQRTMASNWIDLYQEYNLAKPPMQNPSLIASGDPKDTFVCLAYEEQAVSCSVADGAWGKMPFSRLTTGKKITAFAYDAHTRSLFASDDSGKVLASHNFKDWEVWGTGSLGNGIAKELVYDPDKEVLLAVTDRAEIYASFHGGVWVRLIGPAVQGTAAIVSDINHLVYHPIKKKFFAVITYQVTGTSPNPTNPFPWYAVGSFSLTQ